MAIVAPIQRAVDRPPQASSAGESRRCAWSAVSSRHSTTSARCTPAVHYTCAARTRMFQPPYSAHMPTHTLTSREAEDPLAGHRLHTRSCWRLLLASWLAACSRKCTKRKRSLQVSYPNTPISCPKNPERDGGEVVKMGEREC